MPSTRNPYIDISIKSNQQYSATTNSQSYMQTFINNGAVALSDVVNSYFASVTCQLSGTGCNGDKGENVAVNTLGGVDFPSDAVNINQVWGAIGYVFALLMILTLLYPIANVIRALVQEKETKLKEGMMMMALRGDVHYWSWIFHFMCLFLPLSIILTIAGRNLFTYSSPIIIWLYFFLFFLSALSYAYLVSKVFDRALSAAIGGVIVFFAGFFVFVGLETGNSAGQSTRTQILLACLHPATAFTYGTTGVEKSQL